MNYRLAIDYDAMRLLFALTVPHRGKLLRWLEWLRTAPFTEGHVIVRDSVGRYIQVCKMAQFRISFWADHAEKIIHVTRVEVDD